MEREKGTMNTMKTWNQRLLRQSLVALRSATVSELRQKTGLSAVTVGHLLKEFLKEGEVREGATEPSAGGRPARRYHYNPDHTQILVLYTYEEDRQDRLYARVVNRYGETVDGEEVKVEAPSLASFEAVIDRMLPRHPNIKALRFGMPGVEHEGRITVHDYPGIKGTPFAGHFEERYGLPVGVENDVNAAVLGYGTRWGMKGGEGALVYLYLPEKVPLGAGVLIRGEPYHGRLGMAGEMARMWKPLKDPRKRYLSIGPLLHALISILDPEHIVIHAPTMPAEGLEVLRLQLDRTLGAGEIPPVVRSHSFHEDFEEGLIAGALSTLP